MQPCTLLADDRLDTRPLPAHIAVETFRPTITGRLAAELRLRSLTAAGTVVLCMGNLPPLLPASARIAIFLQNRYLCSAASTRGLPLMARLRIAVERQWLRRRLKPHMRVIVQTDSMRRAASDTLAISPTVLPFLGSPPAASRISTPRQASFFYPASAEPHKNHTVLLEAWRLLDESGIKAELHLTVARQSAAATEIARLQARGLQIVNHGPVETDAIAHFYRTSTALIFPSLFESFGLPLLEAQAAGLPIVAAERDYVRDVVDPAETFDPDSPVSIARAVRRLLKTPDRPVMPLTPAGFIERVLTDQY